MNTVHSRLMVKPWSSHHGVVMIMVLIVLVSMLISGVAVLRSVDTSNVLTTNLVLRQSLIQEGEFTLQYVSDRVASETDIPDFGSALPAQNFYPNRLVENDRGVPQVLADLPSPTESGAKTYPHARWNPDTQTLTRYVIDMICEPGTGCTVSPASQGPQLGGAGRQKPRPSFPGGAYVRATIRVDGPRNTVAYIQTIMR